MAGREMTARSDTTAVTPGETDHKVLVYLDPGFSEGGHYLIMAENISEECSKRSIQLLHYVHQDAPDGILPNNEVIKAFEYPAHAVLFPDDDAKGISPATLLHRIKNSRPYYWLKSFPWVWRPARFLVKEAGRLVSRLLRAKPERCGSYNGMSRVASSFGQTCKSIIEQLPGRVPVNGRVVFYMYGSHPSYIAELARVIESTSCPKFLGSFFMNLLYNDYVLGQTSDQFNTAVARLATSLARHDPGGRVVVCADSEDNAQRFETDLKRKMQVLPIPLYGPPTKPLGLDGRDGAITVGYFGYPTVANGYELAVRAYEHFIAERNYPALKFLMRINDQFGESALKSQFEVFRRNTDRLDLVTRFVTSEEHRQLIARCDIIMIPYSKSYYGTRTSGILLDALVQGKVVVVPEDTWMSRTVAQCGSGRKFASGDSQSLLDALEDVIENYGKYKTAASNGIDQLRSRFSAAALLDVLFSESGDF